MHEDGFADPVIAKDPPGAFEDDELDVSVRMKLEHDGRARDRRGDRGGIDLRATRVLRDAQEHGAAAELQVAGAFVETEDRVGAEAGQRLVGEGEFRARFHARSHRGPIADFIAHMRRTRRGLPGKEIDIFDHLTDARFLELRGIDRGES